jgi:putative nucleotidyltransferase with HDIG domain
MNPHRRFLLLLACWLLGGTIVLSTLLATLIQRYTYAETERITQDGVARLFGSELPPDIFDRPLTPDAYVRVDPAVKAQFQVYDIIQARFYGPDGTVTYSYLPAQVGGQQPTGDSHGDLAEAFAGHSSLDIRALGADDNITGRPQADVLETYVPVRRDGRIVGVAEIYRDIADQVAAVHRMQLIIVGAVALVAAVLFLGLAGIYRSSTATIAGQARTLQATLAQLEASYEGTLHALMAALDVRDHETEGHSQRVAAYARAIGDALQLDPDLARQLAHGALLHDIGKIGIPDSILCKDGPLTNEEWLVMRQHPAIGASMLSDLAFLQHALPVVRYHHERWDGRGYPQGLRGAFIPLPARIFAVADTFDAMTSDRPYRRACSIAAAREEILRCSGQQFDPEVVAAFGRVSDQTLASIQSLGRVPAVEQAS